jgi:C-terminal processing protease CtpA/Prc
MRIPNCNRVPAAIRRETWCEIRSGVVLAQRDGALIAVTVLKGMPAARAGPVPGTAMVRVDGRTVNAANLDAVRTLLRGRPGTRVTLQSASGVRRIVLERYL